MGQRTRGKTGYNHVQYHLNGSQYFIIDLTSDSKRIYNINNIFLSYLSSLLEELGDLLLEAAKKLQIRTTGVHSLNDGQCENTPKKEIVYRYPAFVSKSIKQNEIYIHFRCVPTINSLSCIMLLAPCNVSISALS